MEILRERENFTALEEKRKEERLQTFREQRLNVNFMLLMYWVPAYFFDLSTQFPTYNGTHIFTDFLSNWGQSVILIYLIASIIMDVMPDEDRKEWKKKYNDFTQIAVVQAYIVSGKLLILIKRILSSKLYENNVDDISYYSRPYNIILMVTPNIRITIRKN